MGERAACHCQHGEVRMLAEDFRSIQQGVYPDVTCSTLFVSAVDEVIL